MGLRVMVQLLFIEPALSCIVLDIIILIAASSQKFFMASTGTFWILTTCSKVLDVIRIAIPLKEEQKGSLIFICTHNSRRSHMRQMWAMAAVTYYGISGVFGYSGGT